MLPLLELPVLTVWDASPLPAHLGSTEGSTHQEPSEKQTSVSSALANQSNYLYLKQNSSAMDSAAW